MSFFVTGAGGFIGGRLCEKLAESGCRVTAFCHRQPSRSSLLNNTSIQVKLGDIGNQAQIADAMNGSDRCFHLAGYAKQWSRNGNDFHRINVDGTRNVMNAAIDCGVSKVVFTSTAGVYGPSNGNEMLNEESFGCMDDKTEYERSKREAELLVQEIVDEKKLNACIVNPTRVFGSGLFDSNALARIFVKLLRCERQFLPQPDFIGNYVYIDDVVDGHLNAMEHGVAGRNYILGGENLRFDKLLNLMIQAADVIPKIVYVPKPVITAYALTQCAWARISGNPPKLTPAFVNKYLANYYLSSERAARELGYEPGSVKCGMRNTKFGMRGEG